MLYSRTNSERCTSERSGSELVECLTQDRGAVGSSLTGVTASSVDPEGGQGVLTPPPPWKITSYMGFYEE